MHHLRLPEKNLCAEKTGKKVARYVYKESMGLPDLEQVYGRFPGLRHVTHGRPWHNYRHDVTWPDADERVVNPATGKSIRPASQKTVAWYEYFILKHAKCPGARVFDGFMGTGASGIAATRCGAARYMAVDSDPDVFAIAQSRLRRFWTSWKGAHEFGDKDCSEGDGQEELRQRLIDTPLYTLDTSPPDDKSLEEYCDMAGMDDQRISVHGRGQETFGEGSVHEVRSEERP